MKQILFILILLFSQIANAAICWEPATQRADTSPFDYLTELSGYNLYVGDVSGVYDTTIALNDPTLKCYDYQSATQKYAVMTSVDTGGRESAYSTEVIIQASEIIPILKPNTVSDFSVTQETGTLNYTFAWLAPSTFDDGVTPLPAGSIVKFYLFDNGKWVQDIQYTENSIYKTLMVGDHLFEMEVEIRNADGSLSVSERSPMVAAVVRVSPNQPHTIMYTLPDGYRTIEIMITPVN